MGAAGLQVLVLAVVGVEALLPLAVAAIACQVPQQLCSGLNKRRGRPFLTVVRIPATGVGPGRRIPVFIQQAMRTPVSSTCARLIAISGPRNALGSLGPLFVRPTTVTALLRISWMPMLISLLLEVLLKSQPCKKELQQRRPMMLRSM